MSINPILNSVSAALAKQSTPVSVKTPAPAVAATDSDTVSVTVLQPTASQPVLQNSSLISASTSIAQLGSLLEVAQSGTEGIGSVIVQLQSLALQASKSGNTQDLSSVSSAFQQLLSKISSIASSTSFGGVSLLNGTFSGGTLDEGDSSAISLSDLSAKGLFGNALPDISTPENASSALGALSLAQTVVSDTDTLIGNLLGQLGFAAATVNSALANKDAAASTLSDADFSASGSGDLESLLGNPQLSAQAQALKLPPALLGLLQE